MRQPLKRKITAVMAADIAEYTRIMAEDEEETLSRLEAYRMVFDDFVVRAGGRVFNSAGDSVMCEFPSAVEATRCAIDIQESLRTRNLAYPAHRQMHFRIGISIGDAVERDGDLLGDVVNIAARLQSLAEPGSICVSRSVQEAVANKTSLPSLDLGHREVKNLPYPVHAFKIEVNKPAGRRSAPTEAQAAGPSASAPRSIAPWILSGILVAAGGIGLHWLIRAKEPAATEAATTPQSGPARPAQGGSGNMADVADAASARGSDQVSSPAGVAPRAVSATERYHNARQLEGRGELGAARREYAALVVLHPDAIDPPFRLASLVRAQEGSTAAREALAELARQDNPSARLMHALQFDRAERLRRLEAFAEAHPDFAPAHYLLAAELVDGRQDGQTLAEKRREQAALDRFLTVAREGKLSSFFLDRSLLGQWMDLARTRDAVLRSLLADGRDQISAAFTPSNTGWIGTIALPEPAIGIEYRLGHAGPFRSTGLLQVADPRTGRPMPRASIEFPHQTAPTEIAIRYIDTAGVFSPVTTIAFDPRTALQRGTRDILQGIAPSWLAFGSGQNSHRVYFTALLSYRCAIDKVEVGFNGQTPREVFFLPPCDPGQPLSVPADAQRSLDLAPSVESVTVRLTFVGGDVSEVATFPRPVRR
ncbi:MAG: hypothetical protein FD152_979 [Xanthobacteraceae bacterium]|nr:MAG: hypothetical protein FD152_979 [Xanthobacteraceae bacterium]